MKKAHTRRNRKSPSLSLYLEPLERREAPTVSGIWANSGQKITPVELRAAQNPVAVRNSAWDGSNIQISGARNETVSAQLILEAASGAAQDVSVTVSSLVGPGGASIASRPASGDGLFNFVGRNVEVFVVKYQEIKGLSRTGSDFYDERHIPEGFRLPYDPLGHPLPGLGWPQRPNHNQQYPEIAVPHELEPRFTIPAARNQAVWLDVYIPRDTPAGRYSGTVAVREGNGTVHLVPLALKVNNFTLPDKQ